MMQHALKAHHHSGQAFQVNCSGAYNAKQMVVDADSSHTTDLMHCHSIHCAEKLVVNAKSTNTTDLMHCHRICWTLKHRCQHLCSAARAPSQSRMQSLWPSLGNLLQLKPKLPQLQVVLQTFMHNRQHQCKQFLGAFHASMVAHFCMAFFAQSGSNLSCS